MLSRIVRRSIAGSSRPRLVRAQGNVTRESEATSGQDGQEGGAVNPTTSVTSESQNPPLARNGAPATVAQDGSSQSVLSLWKAAEAGSSDVPKPSFNDLIKNTDWNEVYTESNPHPMQLLTPQDPKPDSVPDAEWDTLTDGKRIRLLRKAKFHTLSDVEQAAWRAIGIGRQTLEPGELTRAEKDRQFGSRAPPTFGVGGWGAMTKRNPGDLRPEEKVLTSYGGLRKWDTTPPPAVHPMLAAMNHTGPPQGFVVPEQDVDPNSQLLPPLESKSKTFTILEWCSLTEEERQTEWARAHEEQAAEWRQMSWDARNERKRRHVELEKERFEGLTRSQRRVKIVWDRKRKEIGVGGYGQRTPPTSTSTSAREGGGMRRREGGWGGREQQGGGAVGRGEGRTWGNRGGLGAGGLGQRGGQQASDRWGTSRPREGRNGSDEVARKERERLAAMRQRSPEAEESYR